MGNTSEWNTKYFIPVGCFLLFSIAEFSGSATANLTKWPKNTQSGSICILILALFRLGFVPLFLFCNAAPNQRFNTSVSI